MPISVSFGWKSLLWKARPHILAGDMAGEWACGDLVSIICFIMKHFCDEGGNITDTGVAEVLSLKQVNTVRQK